MRTHGTMRCPRCEQESLAERERDSIVIDVCPACRGVWLDRGELEKLIARALREEDERLGPATERFAAPVRHEAYDRRSDDDRWRYERRPADDRMRHVHDDDDYKRHKKKGRWTDVFDIFD